MAKKEVEAAPAEGAEGVTDRDAAHHAQVISGCRVRISIADHVGEEARHLGHNFEENFPGLVEAADHLLEQHPKVREEVEHLEHNFAENFPHLTGHAKENGNA